MTDSCVRVGMSKSLITWPPQERSILRVLGQLMVSDRFLARNIQVALRCFGLNVQTGQGNLRRIGRRIRNKSEKVEGTKSGGSRLGQPRQRALIMTGKRWTSRKQSENAGGAILGMIAAKGIKEDK